MEIKKQIALTLSACMLLTTGITASATPVNAYATNVYQQAGNDNTMITTNGDGNVVTNGDGNTVVFIDIPNNYWAKEQISQFAQQGIINGYSDGSFRPQANVTREEFCKLLVMSFKPQATNLPDSPTFSDVLETRWSYGYVEACREFLTGYANPFGGRPAFHPTENATREDIAVALVRMMGYKESDASNADYAVWHFEDGNSISPQLRAYVSIAYEKGLITGYPDGTFRPEKGVTRAEVVVMLNRATKQAVTDINADLNMTALLDYSTDKKTVFVGITAEPGTTVTVNGETVSMSSNYNGLYEGHYTYQFPAEGSKEFVVTGTRAGKTKTITLTGSYAVKLPELEIGNCPTAVSEKTITVSGTIFSQNSGATLTLNGQQIQTAPANERRSWSKNLTLKEGSNTLTFVLTNQEGLKVTETKTITCTLEGPVLKITDCPASSSTKEVTISGTMRDANSKMTLSLNGKQIDSTLFASATDRNWRTTYQLKEGTNTLNFELTNENGKTVKETRTIQFNAEGPVLKITYCPTSSTTDEVTIRGTMQDANSKTTLTLNGKYVDATFSAGNTAQNWSTTYELQEGENTLNFELTSDNGKKATETRTIQFNAEGPVLKITNCPTTSRTSEVTISGTMRDANNKITLTLNGKYVDSTYYGSKTDKVWRTTYELQEGENTLNFELTSDNGKTATETRTIQFSAAEPSIRFIFCPETTSTQDITLRFNVEGETDDIHVYVNDQEIYNYSYNSQSYTYPVTLKSGDNVFTIRAVNGYGKAVTETKTIRYNDGKSQEETPADDDNNNTDETAPQGDFTEQVLQLVNEERAKEGLSTLSTTSALQQAAAVRAQEQVQKFSHTRPDGTDCFTALDQAGISYMAAGENIACGQRTPADVMNSWMNSSGHRANILSSNFTNIGIGYVNENNTSYWVQMFIG